MQIDTDSDQESTVAILRSAEPLITDGQSALDLIATVSYETGCHKLLIEKAALGEAFFDLRSGLAGEVLQKCINYHVKLAIVGDFAEYSSKSLQALIRESNRGRDAFFAPDEASALAWLHALRT